MWLGGSHLSWSRCVLFYAHRYRPNHEKVLKNKDQNNRDKDEGKRVSSHVFGISPDYRHFLEFVKG